MRAPGGYEPGPGLVEDLAPPPDDYGIGAEVARDRVRAALESGELEPSTVTEYPVLHGPKGEHVRAQPCS